jgi:tetratricopeptide (TPR) repeat protein
MVLSLNMRPALSISTQHFMSQNHIPFDDTEGRDQVADRLRTNIADGQKHFNEKRINEAFVHYIDIVSEASEKLGDHDILTLDANSYLAEILHKNREFYGAMKLNQEILREREKIQGTSYWKTVWTRNDLARNFSAMGLLNRAETLYSVNRSYLDGQGKRSLEQEHSTLAIFQDLAIREYYQNRYEEAEELFRELLNRKVSSNEEMHYQTVENRLYLAAALCELGRIEEALGHLKTNIAILKEAARKNEASLDMSCRLAERCTEVLNRSQNTSLDENLPQLSTTNSVSVSPSKQEETCPCISEPSWSTHLSKSGDSKEERCKIWKIGTISDQHQSQARIWSRTELM